VPQDREDSVAVGWRLHVRQDDVKRLFNGRYLLSSQNILTSVLEHADSRLGAVHRPGKLGLGHATSATRIAHQGEDAANI
jgi:hypothetical protein